MNAYGRARPWVVIPGFSDRNGVTFDNKGTGISARTFATEAAARKAAESMVTPDADNCRFHAVRLWCYGDWEAGIVDDYLSTDDDGFTVTRRNLLAELANR